MDNPVQTVQDRIDDEYKVAFKAKDKKLYTVLRFMLSVIKQKTIDERKELTNDEIMALIKSEVKKRKDALSDFEKGGREDLIEQTNYEIEILEKYLPEQLSDDDLKKVVQETIEECGGTSECDMAKVMANTMPKVKGVADGGRVRDMAKELLNQ